MVRVTEISAIEKPHISDVEDLIVRSVEELFKVLSRFNQVCKPDEGGQVCLLALQKLTSELHLLSIFLISSLYNMKKGVGVLELMDLKAWKTMARDLCLYT